MDTYYLDTDNKTLLQDQPPPPPPQKASTCRRTNDGFSDPSQLLVKNTSYCHQRPNQRERQRQRRGTAEQARSCNPMGKCISKQPSAITIALSTTDLATANHILSKFSDNADYISLKDEHGNPLYEYFGQGNTEIFYETAKREDNIIGIGSDCWKRTTTTTTKTSTSTAEDSNNNKNYRRTRQEEAGRVPVDCNSFGDTECGLDNEGQSESKKSSKKAGGPETKGTAMSFGFRKKLHNTPKKSKNLQKQKEMLENNLTQNCDEKIKQKLNFDTVITNTTDVVENATTPTTTNLQQNDKNGNNESTTTTPQATSAAATTTTTTTPMVTFEKVGAGKTQHHTIPSATTQGVPSENTAVVGRSILTNRFGFKGTNTVRPASTGITPRYQSDFQDNVDNNNYSQTGNYSNNNFNNNNINSTIKRRSKSAHSGRAMTPNLSNLDRQQQFDESRHQPHAPKITQKSLNYHSNEYQRSRLQFLQQPPHHQQQQQQQQQAHRPTPCLVNPPQYTFVNTGMHTNVIVRPTPRPPSATYSKFTLQTTSLPKPEYPVPIRLNPSSSSSSAAAAGAGAGASSSTAAIQAESTTPPMDQKTAKQMANTNRKGFQGSREISADSGIASLDAALAETTQQPTQTSGSPRRNRSRPRNLQMVMSGRHKFEVRDLEDPLSSDSAIEPLALPKLPSAFSSDNQTVPLSGLIRSNTVLTREAFFRSTGSTEEQDAADTASHQNHKAQKNTSDSEGLEEEKLFLDRSTSEKCAKNHQFKDINTFSKNSSPGSSRTSWCNAGESLAIKDCSSLSMSSSDESKDNQNEKTDAILPITEDISPTMITDIAISSISSITESSPQLENDQQDANIQQEFKEDEESRPERPTSLTNITESKFAEMAAAVASEFLLDDETSPTDSLVSSTESEDVVCKRQKKKNNLEIQEKDIDEISPEFEVCSPLSPGTPTHASHSLSLSDCGRDFLIDDEIADQPALLFNESTEGIERGAHLGHSHNTDTPTLMETGSMRSLKSQSKARSALQAAIELSLRTPVSLRKAVLNRAESLDTLSPCESICSDDLMMDFDVNSSMDSIDKMSASIRSRSGSALHKMDDSQMLSELEGKGSDMMRELNTILRVHNRSEKDNNMIAHLPARATRLLNRSRLQQCQLSNNGSDSPKSTDSFRRTPSRASSLHHSQRDTNSSSDDLMLHDKSFRNAMIQDVLHFKKQLLRLRRILQEDEDCLMRTDTLNPFDTNNGQLFASCGLDTKFLEDIDVASLTSSTTDDPIQELADLRRQVVYLQGQVDDRDRTIRIQKTLIDKLESADTGKYPQIVSEKECVNTATQTERTRPLSIGPEGLSRSKPEYTSYTTHFPATTIITTTTSPLNDNGNGTSPTQALTPTNNQTRRHTVISTTFTNYNQISPSPRRASIAWEQQRPNAATVVYKPVKITLIGDPMCQSPERKHNNGSTTKTTTSCNGGRDGDLKSNRSSSNNSSSSSSDLVDEENRRNVLNGYHNLKCNGKENGYEEIEVRNRNHHHNHHHNHLKKHNQHQQHLPQQNQQQKKQQNLTPTVTIV